MCEGARITSPLGILRNVLQGLNHFMSRCCRVVGQTVAVMLGQVGLIQGGVAQELVQAAIVGKPVVPDLTVPQIPVPAIVVPGATTPLELEPPNPEALSRSSLEKTEDRYPNLMDPRGEVLPLRANQRGRGIQLDTVREGKRSIIQHGSYKSYDPADQMYRVLPGNRVVIETQGWEAHLDYQGREYTKTIEEKIQSTQALWGLQSVWVVPQSLQDLLGRENFSSATILSVAGEVTGEVGQRLPQIRLNTAGYTAGPPNLGSGSTYSSNGGGLLFTELEAGNTPTVLQAYPTNNLQVFTEGEGLVVGAKTPSSLLKKAGIVFGDPLTGRGFEFQPEVTSFPGVKIAQADKFDNLDLLNVLVNPFLEPATRDLFYLNSLHWISLGLQNPKILSTAVRETNQDWYQLRWSRPHNRTLIQYEKPVGLATYYNVFANPGVALSLSFDKNAIHRGSSANGTVGALVGALFDILSPKRIEKSLWEGRLQRDREDPFAPLRTSTTVEQRREINQRLNRTLDMTGRISAIAQLSGSFTSPSGIRPEASSLFQVRAGLLGRRLRPIQVDQGFEDGDTFISKLRLSNQRFGPLDFIGVPVDLDRVNASVVQDRATAVKVVVSGVDGKPKFELESSSDPTVVPVAVRTFASAFDRIELSQIGTRETVVNRFDGTMYVPTVEVLRSGSRGNFSYGWSGGAWWNLAANVAPNVVRNDFGEREKRFGIYGNGLLNWSSTKVVRDRQQVVRQVVNHTTGIKLAVNSQSNGSNPSTLTLSHSYVKQTPLINYNLTGGLFLTGSIDGAARDLRAIAFMQGMVRWAMGLEMNYGLEMGREKYQNFELSKTVGKMWAVGLYGRNYSVGAGVGTRDRLSNGFGLVVTHNPKLTMGFKTLLGYENKKLELQFKGNLSF